MQEPRSPKAIKAFTDGKGVAHSTEAEAPFRIMEKIKVNGKDTHPVYGFLKKATASADIKWNFGTYFLISSAGAVECHQGAQPSALKPRVEELLATG